MAALTCTPGLTWTPDRPGYRGNAGVDWLQLLLLPLVFPTIVLPALVSWGAGDAAGSLRTARRA
jgi:hypothetical protein